MSNHCSRKSASSCASSCQVQGPGAPLTGVITIIKETDPEKESPPFRFTGDLGDFTLRSGQSKVFADLLPGVYHVVELPLPDWALVEIQCDDRTIIQDNKVEISLKPFQSVTCRFINTDEGCITVIKEVDGPDATFPFTINGDPFEITTSGGTGMFHLMGLQDGPNSLVELIPDGWFLTEVSCENGQTGTTGGPGPGATGGLEVDVMAGKVEVCTFKNVKGGNIITTKLTDPTPSQQSFEFDPSWGNTFPLTDGQSNDSGFLLPGTYTVIETIPDGWDLIDVSCTGGVSTGTTGLAGSTGGVEVELLPNATVECTFTNQQRGCLTVEKEIVTVQGTGPAFEFTGTDPIGPFSLSGGEKQKFANLIPGQYTVTETVPTGWNLTEVSCTGGDSTVIPGSGVMVDVLPGGNSECKFTNTERSNLSITKITDPNTSQQSFDFVGDGGLGQFNLFNGQTQTFTDIDPGIYTVIENIPSGWDLINVSCTGTGGVSTGTTGGPGPGVTGGVIVELEPGADVSCTFENTQRGTITIRKRATPQDTEEIFEFTGDLGVFVLAGQDEFTFDDLLPGPYQVNEVIPDGWILTEIGCSSGPVDTTGVPGIGLNTGGVLINLEAGGNETCTFFNSERPSITIIKEIDTVNNTGPEFPFEIENAVSGMTAGFSLTGGNSITFDNLEINNNYIVGELVPDGWQVSDIACQGTGVINIGDTFVEYFLGPGDHPVCTFTNQELVQITTNKVALGEDGFFNFFQSDPLGTGTFGIGTSNGTGSNVSDRTQLPGQYFLGELSNQDFVLTDFSCTGTGINNVMTGATGGATGLFFDAAPGATVDCTFTNERLASLTVTKSALAGNFEFKVVGPSVDEIFTLNAGGSQNYVNIIPGQYTIEENIPDGWFLTDINCGGSSTGTIGGPGDIGRVVVNLAPGADETCTFTNELAASLTIVKLTDPNPDQTNEVFQFNGDLKQFELQGGEARIFNNLAPGTYNVFENIPAGWNLTNVSCTNDDNGTIGGPGETGGVDVTLASGDDVTCTFTNTQLSTIIIDKQAEGGDETFEYELDGPSTLRSKITTSGGTGSTSFANVLPGAYTLTETAPPGWVIANITCDGAPGVTGTDTINFDVGPGEMTTCLFTNLAPSTVTFRKITEGTTGTFDFTYETGNLTQGFNLTTTGTGLTGAAETAPQDVEAGLLTLTERVPPGWTLTSFSGPSGTGVTGVGVLNDGNTDILASLEFDIAPGTSPTIEITNQRAGLINVFKQSEGNTGSFGYLLDGSPLFTIDTVFPNENAPVADGQDNKLVLPGTYTVTEVPQDGWTLQSIDFETFPGLDAPTGVTGVTGGFQFTLGPNAGINIVYFNVFDGGQEQVFIFDEPGDGEQIVPEGLPNLEYWVVGGGGGGGDQLTNEGTLGGGGGGRGRIETGTITLTPGVTINYTVGAGGPGGSPGKASTITETVSALDVTADGGNPGGNGNADTNNGGDGGNDGGGGGAGACGECAGGAGGVAGQGSIGLPGTSGSNARGGNGGDGTSADPTILVFSGLVGQGGAKFVIPPSPVPYGGGGAGGVGATDSNVGGIVGSGTRGNDGGRGYGAGGGGGNPGGAGADGIVVLRFTS